MAKIQKTFSYDAPDDYLHQTRTLNKVGVWTYDGHDKIWAFVDKETNKLTGDFKTPDENGDTYPTPLHLIKVEIDCNQNPLLACLLGADEVKDYGLLDQHEETLPDGTVYRRPLIPPPDHTYELTDIVYDPTTGNFLEPYPWKKPHMDWDELKRVRNEMLKASDQKIASSTEELKQEWETYRQKLRDLTKTFAGVDAWKVPFPAEPGAKPAPTNKG